MTIEILGAGNFGMRAFKTLGTAQKIGSIRIIDQRPERIESLRSKGIDACCEEAVRYLIHTKNLSHANDVIVPCVPIHVAYRWLLEMLPENRKPVTVDVPEAVRRKLPNPMDGPDHALFVSHATFRCPDDCPEPADFCTHTGLPRPTNLFDLLEQPIEGGLPTIVVRSRQLAPGVGGYRMKALFDALDRLKGLNGIVLVATACRCHGVVHALDASNSVDIPR